MSPSHTGCPRSEGPTPSRRSGAATGFLRSALLVFSLALALGAVSTARAGGGGERLLLVVNPADEQQVRIANEYVRLRAIPACNIVSITTRLSSGFILATEADTGTGFTYVNHYLQPIADHIAAQGLGGQIDYIASLGQPFRMTGLSGGAATSISHDYALMHLDALVSGTTPETVSSMPSPRDEIPGSYTEGTNEALLHSSDGLYVGTTLAFTGIFGNAPADVITNLQRTVAADGTRPAGTIYFEENDNVRSNTREFQWPSTQAGLTARGIPFVQEFGTSGNTPLNRADVRGVVIGAATYTIPNGSAYLPGSWADSLTSFGTNFDTFSQTKAAELIRVGAGGSSGTVIEPFAISARFPHSHIFLYSADGSSIGEAFYKSVATPLLQLMLGDPLGQPYADVPSVTIDSGPADGATVSGTVPVTASAILSNPNLATAIGRIDLYIDGKLADTMAGATASFNIDTTALSNGRHEWRIVAVNNAAAKSQNHMLRHFRVDNDGRAVTAGGDIDAGTAASVDISVFSLAGTGIVTGIELRLLGRAVGQVSGGSGVVHLDMTQLGFGDNTLTPVAIFSDGAEVAGNPITVSRSPVYLAGTPPLAPRNRQFGILGEYFLGQGATTIDGSTFTGTPDASFIHSTIFIGVHDGADFSKTAFANNLAQLAAVEPNPLGSVTDLTLVHQLSARYTGRFEADTAGEYNFFHYKSNDSMRLLIDGQTVMGYDNRSFGLPAHYSPSVFLSEGEHTLTLLTANTNTGNSRDGFFDVALYVRKPDGVMRRVDDTFLYQFIARPDPSVVGHWTQDEAGAADGGAIGTVVNVANPGTLDGQGVTGAAFSTDIPASAIFDPITASKRPNAFSLDASISNARVRILDDPALNIDNAGNRSFTVEFFVKIENQFPGFNAFMRRLVSGPDPDSATSSDRHAWQVDFDHGTSMNFGKVRARWDLPGIPPSDYNRVSRGGYVFVDTDGATGDPSDYTFATGDPAAEGDGLNDTAWHHVAMVYDGTLGEVILYTDYQRFGSVAIQGPFTHPPANFEFGNFASASGLLFDEVRYTEGVLDESLFLTATTLSALEAWRFLHYGIADNTGDAANLADPNGDLVVNLIAYAFGLDPHKMVSGLLPTPVRSGNNLTVNFTQPPGISGIVYGAQYSVNLADWFPIPDTGSGANHIFTTSVSTSPTLFIRLVVTDP